jgi:hypothetical protein
MLDGLSGGIQPRPLAHATLAIAVDASVVAASPSTTPRSPGGDDSRPVGDRGGKDSGITRDSLDANACGPVAWLLGHQHWGAEPGGNGMDEAENKQVVQLA